MKNSLQYFSKLLDFNEKDEFYKRIFSALGGVWRHLRNADPMQGPKELLQCFFKISSSEPRLQHLATQMAYSLLLENSTPIPPDAEYFLLELKPEQRRILFERKMISMEIFRKLLGKATPDEVFQALKWWLKTSFEDPSVRRDLSLFEVLSRMLDFPPILRLNEQQQENLVGEIITNAQKFISMDLYQAIFYQETFKRLVTKEEQFQRENSKLPICYLQGTYFILDTLKENLSENQNDALAFTFGGWLDERPFILEKPSRFGLLSTDFCFDLLQKELKKRPVPQQDINRFLRLLPKNQRETLHSLLREELTRFEKRQYTKGDLDSLTESTWQNLTSCFPGPSPIHLESMKGEFQLALEEAELYKAFETWMKSLLPNYPMAMKELSSLTLRELLEHNQQVLNDIQGDFKLYTDLIIYLVSQKSKLFSSLFHKDFSRQGGPQDVERIVQSSHRQAKFLQDIFTQQKVEMSNITALEEIIEKFQGKANFDREMNLVLDYFAKKKMKGVNEGRIKSVKNAISLLSYLRKMASIFSCLKQHGMNCASSNEIKQLEALHAKYSETKNSIQLDAASAVLEQVRKNISDISPEQMDFFAMAADAQDLVSFFANEKNFRENVQLLNSQLQGQEFYINMITDAQVAHRFLSIFLQKGVTFKKILEHIKDCSAGGRLEKLNAIETSKLNLTEIKVRFAQVRQGLQGIIPRILSFMRDGWFSSSISVQGSNLALQYQSAEAQKAMVLTDEDVDDMIRGIRFCQTSELSAEDRLCFDGFLECYQLAAKVHAQRQVLHHEGHPEYQDCELNFGKGFTRQSLGELLGKTQNLAERWRREKEDSLGEVPRLLILSNAQLLSFLSMVIQIASRKDTESIGDLLSYLLYLFPELEGAELEKGEKLEKGAKASLKGQGYWGQGADLGARAMQVAKTLVLDLERSLEAGLDGHRHKQGACSLYDASRFSRVQVEALLLEVFSEPPLPFQVFQPLPESHTVLEDLKTFLRRTSQLHWMMFAIVGVNLLPALCREELVKWILEAPIPDELALIFTGEVGLEMFSFLRKKEATPLERDQLSKLFKGLRLLEQRGLASFVPVTGQAGDGKTTFIKATLEEVAPSKKRGSNNLSWSLNENFRPQELIDEIRQLKPPISKVALHLNLSVFAPLPAVHQMLRTLLYSGFLLDEATGGICRLRTMHPSGSPFTWHLYIEVPQATPELLKEGVLDQVPFLQLVGAQKHLDSRHPFLVDEQVRLVCAFIKLEREGSLDTASLDISAPTVSSDEECRELLADLFKRLPIPEVKSHQMAFVRHLHGRCHFLRNFSADNRKLNRSSMASLSSQDSHIYSKIFAQFLSEVTFFCNGKLEGDWAATKQGFLCMPPGNSLNLNLLHLSCQTEAEARSLTKLHGISVLDQHTATEAPARLRADLAPALEIPSERLVSILQRGTGYVLTPDFALKLYVLNEKRKAGISTLFSGDTGVGKTELLRIFSEILNAGEKVLPDFFFELRECLLSRILLQPDRKTPRQPAYAPFLTAQGALARYDLADNKMEFLMELLRSIGEQAEADLPRVAHALLEFALDLQRRFPLLTFPLPLKSLISEWHARTTAHMRPPTPGGANQALPEIDFNLITGRIIAPVMGLTAENLFHKILMSESVTAKEFRERVLHINSWAEKNTNAQVVIFVDELNTSTIMGMVKEAFVDRTLAGTTLCRRLFFVGAINPASPQAHEGEGTSEQESLADFVVRPHPPSMDVLIMKFSSLTKAQERHFLTAYLRDRLPEAHRGVQAQAQAKRLLLEAQQFVRACRLFRVHPSIRDFVRAVTLLHFFLDQGGQGLLSPANRGQRSPERAWWQALLMTVAVTYAFRLPAEPLHRFELLVERLMGELQCPFQGFSRLVEGELSQLYDRFIIQPGIAKTRSLQINLFCNVVAMQARLPLLITGDPGRSKTLSFNIACDNMKGPSSKSDVFRPLCNINRFHYQCSESSTSAEIRSVYETACRSQQTFEQAQMLNEQCVVFLDEGGLPGERKHALKVFHYYADHPTVGTVILSNTTLDAAKTNRCIQVLLPAVDDSDLQALATGLIFGEPGVPERLPQPVRGSVEALIRGSCQAFPKANGFAAGTRPGLFDMRDFVYYLRDLRRQLDLEGAGAPLTGEMVYHALQRNYNGIPAGAFEELARCFFGAINHFLHEARLTEIAPPQLPQTLVEVLRESIEQRLVKEDEDPNQASHRYVMLVDPAGAESSLTALRILGIPGRSRLKTVAVSDFPADDSELVKSQQVSEVKSSMELGETVALVNSGPIQTNFYELFNRYFVSALGNDERRRYYANIAVGSFSRPCAIHPRFQIIVTISLDEFKAAPAPFLNRFEKYLLCLKDAYEHHPQLVDHPVLGDLLSGIRHFISTCQPHSFYGLIPDETLYSLVLTILELTCQVKARIPRIPQPLTSLAAGEEAEGDPSTTPATTALLEALVGTSSSSSSSLLLRQRSRAGDDSDNPASKLRRLIRQANFYLLQLARPEAVYLLRHLLPREYLVEYLLRQEHFSFLNFFHHLLRLTLLPETARPGVGLRWILFTRTSGELFQLAPDQHLRELLLAPYPGRVDANALMATFSLKSTESAQACRAELEAFFASPTRRILICLADMASVTRLQVSYARKVVDELSEQHLGEEPRLVLFLVHFPPTKIQLAPCYEATFSGGWQFSYLDSFGVQYLAADGGGERSLPIPSPDLRKWLRVGFEIEGAALTLSDFDREFQAQITSTLKAISDNPAFIVWIRPTQKQLWLIPIHRGRQEALERAFSQPGFREGLLGRLASAWSPQEIRLLFDMVCRSLQEGTSVLSISDHVRVALDSIVLFLVQEAVVRLSRDGGLRSLEELGATASPAALKGFLKAALQALEVPTPRQIAQGLLPTLQHVSHSYSVPLVLPFSTFLLPQLRRLWDAQGAQGLPFDEHAALFSKALRASPLRAVVLALENDAALFEALSRDFLGTCFELYRATPPPGPYQERAFLRWLELRSPKPGYLAGLFGLLTLAFRQELSFLSQSLEGLQGCSPERLPSLRLEFCLSPEELLTRLRHCPLELLKAELGRAEQPGQEALEELQGVLTQTFRRFRSFGRLWTYLSPVPDTVATGQPVALFFFLLSLLLTEAGVSLASLPWVTLRETLGEAQDLFLTLFTQGLRGFALALPILELFWTHLASKAARLEAQPQLLFSMLEGTLLLDLRLHHDFSQPSFKAAHGACHCLPYTLKGDLRLLLELLNESSPDRSHIWGTLPALSIPHLLRALLRDEEIRGQLEDALSHIMSLDPLLRQVLGFVPPHFSDNPQPSERSLVASVFEVLLADLSETKEQIVPVYRALQGTRLETPLDSLRFKAAQVVLLTHVGQELGTELARGLSRFEAHLPKFEDVGPLVASLYRGKRSVELYFLSCLGPPETALSFLKDHRACSIFEISKEFAQNEALKGMQSYLFPFMVDGSTPEGKEYHLLEKNIHTPSSLAAEVTKLCGAPGGKGPFRARLYLATIAYYMYYALGKACPNLRQVVTQLKGPLLLTEPEERAFALLTEGGVPLVPDDDLAHFFSNERLGQLPPEELVYRHLLMNLLLVTLGCPPRSNHLYARTHAPELLSLSVRGPASASSNDKDCGFKLGANGVFEGNPGILGNSPIHRLTLAFMTWGACAMGLLVNADPRSPSAQRHRELVERLCLEGSYHRERDLARLDRPLALRRYILEKPNTFFFWLSADETLRDRRIEPAFYVTQILYRFWQDVVARFDGTPACVYQAAFPSSKHTTDYENQLLQAAFEPVLQNATALREPYNEFLKGNQGFQALDGFQKRLDRVLLSSSRLISYRHLIDQSAALPLHTFPCIQRFKDFSRFSVIQKLPFLVHLHHWIQEKLGGLLEEGEAYTLTFADCLERMEAEDDRRYGGWLFQEAKETWRFIKEGYSEYQVCGHAYGNGEQVIPELQDSSPIARLINTGRDELDADHLFRLVKDLAEIQNAVVREHDVPKVRVSMLPRDPQPYSLLIRLEEDDNPIGWAISLATLANGNIHFNWQALEKRLKARFLTSVVEFEIPPSPLFPFHRPPPASSKDEAPPQEAAPPEEPISVTVTLSKLLKAIPPEFSEDQGDEARWTISLSNLKEEDLLALIKILSLTCISLSHLSKENAPPDPLQSLSEFIRSRGLPLGDVQKRQLDKFKVPLKGLKSFSHFLIITFHEKGFLFSNIPQTLNSRLPLEVSQTLFSHLFERQDLSASITLLQGLANLLLAPDVERILSKVPNNFSLRAELRVPLRRLALDDAELSLLLPHSVLTMHYAFYLRELHKTLGKLRALILEQASLASQAQGYSELIPEDCKALEDPDDRPDLDRLVFQEEEAPPPAAPEPARDSEGLGGDFLMLDYQEEFSPPVPVWKFPLSFAQKQEEEFEFIEMGQNMEVFAVDDLKASFEKVDVPLEKVQVPLEKAQVPLQREEITSNPPEIAYVPDDLDIDFILPPDPIEIMEYVKTLHIEGRITLDQETRLLEGLSQNDDAIIALFESLEGEELIEALQYY